MLVTQRIRVGIILDNPLRELQSTALLSYFLAKKGLEVVIIPMYDQELHVRLWRPQILILNHARPANAHLIKLYKQANIRLVVLDTEGGILRCEYRELINPVQECDSRHFLDYYFLWGNRQYKAFKEKLGEEKPKLMVTGSPRMDFYREPWVNCVEKPVPGMDGYVFIPMSFSFNNPKFTTKELEIFNMRDVMGLDVATLREMQKKFGQAQEGMIALVVDLAKKYPMRKFVVRPHPFENEKGYLERFSNFSNVIVTLENDISSWLRRAEIVLQMNSSCGVEGALLGRKVLSLEMFQHESIRVSQCSECSIMTRTHEEFFDVFDALLNGRTTSYLDSEIQRSSESVKGMIRDWLHEVDGKRAEFVAERLDVLAHGEFVPLGPVEFEKGNLVALKKKVKFVVRRVYNKIFDSEKEERRSRKSFSPNDIFAFVEKFKNPSEAIRIESKRACGFKTSWDTEAVFVTSQ